MKRLRMTIKEKLNNTNDLVHHLKLAENTKPINNTMKQ